MSNAKLEAIEEFEEMVYFERRVVKVVAQVMAQNPRTIVIAWEDSGGTKVTGIPFSENLVKGMVGTLYDMVYKEPDDSDEDNELSG